MKQHDRRAVAVGVPIPESSAGKLGESFLGLNLIWNG
jgi:hypothetical protein